MPYCDKCQAPVEGNKVVSLTKKTIIRCEYCGNKIGELNDGS